MATGEWVMVRVIVDYCVFIEEFFKAKDFGTGQNDEFRWTGTGACLRSDGQFAGRGINRG